MVTCTPIYMLPYAEGSDPPCDIDETLCAFAADVEALLDRLDAEVDRTYDTVPMVQLKLTAPLTFVSSGNSTITIPFDTISFDTANFVSLADNPYQINLPRGGRYLASYQVQIASVLSGDTVASTFASTTGTVTPCQELYISDGSLPVYMNSGGELRYSPGGLSPSDTQATALTFVLNVLTGTFVIDAVTVCLTWIGDLP